MNEDSLCGSEKASAAGRHLCAVMLRTAAFAVVLIVMERFLFGALTVSDNAMFPQIRAGDLAVYYRQGNISRKDAVIYQTRAGTAAGRIAAADGDTVAVTDSGMLEINGVPQTVQEREGVFCETEAAPDTLKYPIKLGKDEFFILGDNRDCAADSRVHGIVRRKDIRGVIFILIRRQGV